jgi:hypothetical protein
VSWSLTFYPTSDDPALSDSEVGLQVRTRGVPNNRDDVDALDDAIFDFLQNATLDLRRHPLVGRVSRIGHADGRGRLEPFRTLIELPAARSLADRSPHVTPRRVWEDSSYDRNHEDPAGSVDARHASGTSTST